MAIGRRLARFLISDSIRNRCRNGQLFRDSISLDKFYWFETVTCDVTRIPSFPDIVQPLTNLLLAFLSDLFYDFFAAQHKQDEIRRS